MTTEMQDAFCASFAPAIEVQEHPETLKRARRKSWEQYLAVGLPDAKSEAFHYSYPRLKLCLRQSFRKPCEEDLRAQIEALILAECRDSVLVFVNGTFRPDYSRTAALPRSVLVHPLAQAMRLFSAHLSASLAKEVKEERDPFILLNQAAHQEGCFLYVPPKVKVEVPVQVLHLVGNPEPSAYVMPRMHLFMGALSELSLVTTYHHAAGGSHLFNAVFEATVDNSAQLRYTEYDMAHARVNGWKLVATRLTLKRDAYASCVQLANNPFSRRNWRAHLAAENAKVNLNGLWVLKDQAESHTTVFIDHEAPYCESLQLFKGVLDDASRSSFQGKIMVRKGAEKTQAYQLNNHLVLSDQAQANSKPGLEIFEADVKATHGATSGQLAADQLFYLQTRGFPLAEAKKLLIRGFCDEVVRLIPVDSLAERALAFISKTTFGG